ncbi:MAG: hypothetical protein ACXWM7_06695 [Parachlamydiaceae bacterium]
MAFTEGLSRIFDYFSVPEGDPSKQSPQSVNWLGRLVQTITKIPSLIIKSIQNIFNSIRNWFAPQTQTEADKKDQSEVPKTQPQRAEAQPEKVEAVHQPAPKPEIQKPAINFGTIELFLNDTIAAFPKRENPRAYINHFYHRLSKEFSSFKDRQAIVKFLLSNAEQVNSAFQAEFKEKSRTFGIEFSKSFLSNFQGELFGEEFATFIVENSPTIGFLKRMTVFCSENQVPNLQKPFKLLVQLLLYRMAEKIEKTLENIGEAPLSVFPKLHKSGKEGVEFLKEMGKQGFFIPDYQDVGQLWVSQDEDEESEEAEESKVEAFVGKPNHLDDSVSVELSDEWMQRSEEAFKQRKHHRKVVADLGSRISRIEASSAIVERLRSFSLPAYDFDQLKNFLTEVNKTIAVVETTSPFYGDLRKAWGEFAVKHIALFKGLEQAECELLENLYDLIALKLNRSTLLTMQHHLTAMEELEQLTVAEVENSHLIEALEQIQAFVDNIDSSKHELFEPLQKVWTTFGLHQAAIQGERIATIYNAIANKLHRIQFQQMANYSEAYERFLRLAKEPLELTDFQSALGEINRLIGEIDPSDETFVSLANAMNAVIEKHTNSMATLENLQLTAFKPVYDQVAGKLGHAKLEIVNAVEYDEEYVHEQLVGMIYEFRLNNANLAHLTDEQIIQTFL